MSEDPPPDPLARLGEKIDQARRTRLREETMRRGEPSGGGALGLGFQLAIELVAGLCVGLALGWLAYRFLPRPFGVIGLIGFLFLGMAAGTLNVVRAAKNIGSGGVPPSSDVGGGSEDGHG